MTRVYQSMATSLDDTSPKIVMINPPDLDEPAPVLRAFLAHMATQSEIADNSSVVRAVTAIEKELASRQNSGARDSVAQQPDSTARDPMTGPLPYVVEIREPVGRSVTHWREYLSRVEQLPLQNHPSVQRMKGRAEKKIAELTAAKK